MLNELKEEEEKYNREKKLKEKELENEKKKKEEIRKRKDNEKKDRIEKQKMLGLRWGMLRWVTQYIKENEDEWEKELNEKIEKERKELEAWNKAKRFEKIEILKKKWRKETDSEQKTLEHEKNKSQQNLSISETSENKSQRNLLESGPGIQENESQQNLSLSKAETSENKSQQNLPESESGIQENKSQRNLPQKNIIKDTNNIDNNESKWTVWRTKTNNKNNNIIDVPEDPTDRNEEKYKIKPKILKPRIHLGEKNSEVDNIEELETNGTESDIITDIEVLANQTTFNNFETKYYGFNGVEDPTLQCKLQVGGLGDVHRVGLGTSHPLPPQVGESLVPDQKSEDNIVSNIVSKKISEDNLKGHLNKYNTQYQDRPEEDNISNDNTTDQPVQEPKINNKRKLDTEVTRVKKVVNIKPPTKQQMKITRRKKSVVVVTPDKNQRKITSMFGTSQKLVDQITTPVKSETELKETGGPSEPKLKRSKNSGYARVSDLDVQVINPDLEVNNEQAILTKSLE